MSRSVNDLMVFLNSKLGLKLPVMPLPSWMTGLKSLWQAITNWSGGEPVPTEIKVDVPDGTTITLAGAKLPVKEASIIVATPKSKP